jgi:MFS family permease
LRAYWTLSLVVFLSHSANGATNPFVTLYASSLGASLAQVALVVGAQSAVALASGLGWGRLADWVGRRRPLVWPIWVAEQQGHGRAVFAQLWGLAALVEVPCMLLAGYLVDRVGRRPTFVFGLAGFSVLYLIYSTEPPLVGLVGAQVLRGFAFAAFHATALTMAIELAPAAARGRASSLYTSAQGLAQIGGSWIGGPLAAALGFRSLFVVAAATVMLGAAYSYLAVGRPRARAA